MKRLLLIPLVMFSLITNAENAFNLISTAPVMRSAQEVKLINDDIKSPSYKTKPLAKPQEIQSKTITSTKDILGLYQWEYYNGFNDPTYGGWQFCNLQIVASEEENTVNIYGYFDIKLSASVDIENKKLTISKQFAFESSEGFIFLTPYRWNSNGRSYYEVESISGDITEEGIVFDEDDILALPSPDGQSFYGPLFGYGNIFSAIPTFYFNENEWEEVGSVKFSDGWLKQQGLEWMVDLKRNIENPNRLCIVNPYGENSPYVEANELRTPGYIVIDADDKDCVIVEEMVFSGFKYTYESAFYMHNRESLYLANGQSKEKIKKDFILANKEISHVTESNIIVIPTCILGNVSDPVATYIWTSLTGEPFEMTSKIFLPEDFEFYVSVKSVTLDKTEATLEKGETLELEATISPENATKKEITWTSSNNGVCTVENGVITAIGGGECDIIASVHDGITAKCHIKVVVNPENISFESEAIDAQIGDKLTLSVTFTPEDTTEKDLTWSSSDTEVAIVDGGLVTCLSIGETKITATTTNGLSADCQITVKPVLPESISLNFTEVDALIGDQITIVATITPENTTDKTVNWTSSNSEIATVENGIVTCIAVGDAIITAATHNELSASCSINVNPILVESIEILPSEYQAIEGEGLQLSTIVLPENATNKSIIWSSDNPNVAEVDENGYVNILSTGLAVIRAKAIDGSNVEGICEITGLSGIENLFKDSEVWNIYDTNGHLLQDSARINDIQKLKSGVYVLCNGNYSIKILKRF